MQSKTSKGEKDVPIVGLATTDEIRSLQFFFKRMVRYIQSTECRSAFAHLEKFSLNF